MIKSTPKRKYSTAALIAFLALSASPLWAQSSPIYTNNGNVGIGTSNPRETLEVNGNFAFSNNASIKIYTQGWGQAQLNFGTGGYGSPAFPIGVDVFGTTYRSGLYIWQASPDQDAISVANSSNSSPYFHLTTTGLSIQTGWSRPVNGLEVGTNSAIGNAYLGVSAPANGAIIQGKVGIGTSSPGEKLSISSNMGKALNSSGWGILCTDTYTDGAAGRGGAIAFGALRTDSGQFYTGAISGLKSNSSGMDEKGDLGFYTGSGRGGALAERMRITFDGNVGIGTTTPQNKLDVNGTLSATSYLGNGSSLTITSSSWADYVFEPTYHLTPLPELTAYIKANKHLPDVPTEKEMATKGATVSAMQTVLLRKIEELTLYILQQNTRIEALEKQVGTKN